MSKTTTTPQTATERRLPAEVHELADTLAAKSTAGDHAP